MKQPDAPGHKKYTPLASMWPIVAAIVAIVAATGCISNSTVYIHPVRAAVSTTLQIWAHNSYGDRTHINIDDGCDYIRQLLLKPFQRSSLQRSPRLSHRVTAVLNYRWLWWWWWWSVLSLLFISPFIVLRVRGIEYDIFVGLAFRRGMCNYLLSCAFSLVSTEYL